MLTALKRLPGNTVELTITIPWTMVQSTYERILNELLKEVELPGFRRGKAPKDLALKQINESKVYEEVLKEMVPKIYADSVKEQGLQPIISPHIEVLEAKAKADWKLKITTCEKPEISLGNYREAVRKLHDKSGKIWVPGEDKDDKKPKEPTVGELLEALYTEIKVDLSPLILEQEVNRMLSNLIEQTQKLGLTIEQYLAAQNKTSDSIRDEYTAQAKKTLGLEFALEDIAEAEKVTVEPAEIGSVIKNAKTEAERRNLESQRYYIGSILRRQKTLSQLLKPAIVKV